MPEAVSSRSNATLSPLDMGLLEELLLRHFRNHPELNGFKSKSQNVTDSRASVTDSFTAGSVCEAWPGTALGRGMLSLDERRSQQVHQAKRRSASLRPQSAHASLPTPARRCSGNA